MAIEPEQAPDLAREALDTLVHQFARPMDFLRELVQNAIDAGSPRVEVWVRHDPAEGALEIHVDDFGAGMDERIVDEQLTRMFASTKEGDLTRIGKFGIGFTSVFAIGPAAVLVRTGRHGEAWELLFHADRSFDKTRLDRPVAGTQVTLFVRATVEQAEARARQCQQVLRYWCRHADIPITFEDRTGAQAAPAPAEADPFAAFAAPAAAAGGAVSINEPMGLDAPLQVEVEQDGVRVLAGYTRRPGFGWYNGGLTLLETGDPEALGAFAARLGHLGLEIKCDALEHTLTRDNVVQNEVWVRAMQVAVIAAEQLREQLVARLEAAVAAREPLDAWLELLAREWAQPDMKDLRWWMEERCRIYDPGGTPVSLAQIRSQAEDLGVVLLAGGDAALQRAVMDAGRLVLPDSPAVRALVAACFKPEQTLLGTRQVRAATLPEVFCLATLVPDQQLEPGEVRLVAEAASLLAEAHGQSIAIAVGEFHVGEAQTADDFALEGPAAGGLFRRLTRGRLRVPLFLKHRTVLLDRQHPIFSALLLIAEDDLYTAAASLAHLLLDAADVGRNGRWTEVIAAAWRRVEEGA